MRNPAAGRTRLSRIFHGGPPGAAADRLTTAPRVPIVAGTARTLRRRALWRDADDVAGLAGADARQTGGHADLPRPVRSGGAAVRRVVRVVAGGRQLAEVLAGAGPRRLGAGAAARRRRRDGVGAVAGHRLSPARLDGPQRLVAGRRRRGAGRGGAVLRLAARVLRLDAAGDQRRAGAARARARAPSRAPLTFSPVAAAPRT